jgi:hypothetical protein
MWRCWPATAKAFRGADLKAVVEEAKLLYAHAMASGAESAPWGGSFSVLWRAWQTGEARETESAAVWLKNHGFPAR